MSTTLDDQINQLKQAVAEIEAQRSILGDAAVDASLVPFRQKLADLEAQVSSSREEPPEIPTRQRKLVTLLFMDVVGSTAMTQHLDPEDTLEIMDNFLPRLAAPVESQGGHVTRFTGDGFKALFGDPVAREDDPEHAIRAGLDIQKVARSLAKELRTDWGIEDFQVRIGIDTGLAALGGQTEAEDTVMGRVVNLAVRIESAASPGCLLISHNTYRHVRGVFTVEPQEPITAKGFPEPVPVYRVINVKPRAFRVQTLGVEGVETRMIGRRTEMDFLKDALLTAMEEGEGQVVTISGEAGVGKSRLLYEFQNWIELLPPPQVRFFQGRGRQDSQGLPNSLLRDLFAYRFQVLDDDTGEQARRKIEIGFREVFGTGKDAMMRAHVIGQLLGFDFSASLHLKGVLNDPKQLRNRGLIYLGEYFQALSRENSVVIFLEDIHWADDSSLDAVNHLGESASQLRLLILCDARPTLFERRPYWGEGQTCHTRLELRPLSKREIRQLVTEILKLAKDIPAELRELVVKGAEGNPFYVEELIKMLIEDGVVIPGEESWRVELDRLSQIDVPTTLAGVLQARLDSLPIHERTVLQQASVVGRLFWDRLVAHIQAEGDNGGDPQLVPSALSSLREREFIYRREESAFAGAVEYLFKHDVLREVTYESVIKRLRKTYHGFVADWLISNSGDRIGEYSGKIAEHLLLSGRKEQACDYFVRAGESALASYANREAITHFYSALHLVKSLPDSEERDRQALNIHLSLGPALTATRGWAASELEKNYQQAEQLCLKMADDAQLVPALWLLAVYRLGRSEHEIVDRLVERLNNLAQMIGNPELLCLADLQVSPLYQGKLAMARQILTRASLSRDVEMQRSLAYQYGISPSVVGLAYLGNCLWLEGFPEQAAQRSQEACDFAEELNVPIITCYVLSRICWQNAFAGEIESVRFQAEKLLQITRQHEFRNFELSALFFLHWVNTQTGVPTAHDMDKIFQAMEDYQNLGTLLNRTTFLILFAQACGKAGQIERGLAALDEAIAFGEKTGERWFEAEANRLRGVLMVQQVENSQRQDEYLNEAENYFQAARWVASQQGAKMLELRAVMSLCRLWQIQGKGKDGVHILSEIVSQFTEGLEGFDLSKAKALLIELNG